MSEPTDQEAGDAAGRDVEEPAQRPAAADATTGHPAVDEVLRSLEGLDGRPVDDHVAAFEEAHDALRRALTHAGDDVVPQSED